MSLDQNQQSDILIMDFAKAFDKVCHNLLVHKLHTYGIQGKVCAWISAWLTDRSQSVVLENHSSDTVAVKSGVPQWSVLVPGLHLIRQICEKNVP